MPLHCNQCAPKGFFLYFFPPLSSLKYINLFKRTALAVRIVKAIQDKVGPELILSAVV